MKNLLFSIIVLTKIKFEDREMKVRTKWRDTRNVQRRRKSQREFVFKSKWQISLLRLIWQEPLHMHLDLIDWKTISLTRKKEEKTSVRLCISLVCLLNVIGDEFNNINAIWSWLMLSNVNSVYISLLSFTFAHRMEITSF